MKNAKILLGALSITAIVIGSILFKNSEDIQGVYNPTSISLKKKDAQSWNQAEQYYKELRKNVHTGQIEVADYEAAFQHFKSMSRNKTTSFTFVDEGPDNIGGRTRGIAIDPNNDDRVYIGAVTGGLFSSSNGGNTWSRVQGWDNSTEIVSISSVAITNDGTIYVATGGKEFEESSGAGLSTENSGSQGGDGLWYSTDNGVTFTQVSGTANKDLTKVTPDLSQNDVVYISGTSFGAKKLVNKGSLETLTGTSLASSTTTQDVKVSPDGTVVIVASASTIWTSQDGGTNFEKVSGSGTGNINGSSSRNECAVSYEKNSNGNWNCYVARVLSNGHIGSVWLSEDNGVNWTQIAQQYVSGSGGVSWDPTSSQGNYDLVIEVVKGFPNQCVLGGLNLYKWTKNPNSNPANGNWEAISNWALPKGSQRYIHADIHRLTFNSKGQMYVGNDGGIQMSIDSTLTFFADMNNGYNVTQFYSVAYGPDGSVMGGAQDNGTLYNNHSGFFSNLTHVEVSGGDGFECEISYLNKDAFVTSIYNSGIRRFEGIGGGGSLLEIPAGGPLGNGNSSVGTFYTPLRLFEDPYDTDTQDSIEYIAKETRFSGETINYTSLSFGLPLQYTLTQDIYVDFDTTFITTDTVTATYDTLAPGDTLLTNGIARDTIMLPDYKQSLFVTHTDLGIYLTRDMMRYATPMEWWKISPLGNQAHSFEFSKDGNWLWIGTTGGSVYRVANLDSAYSMEQADYSYRDSATYKLEVDQLSVGGSGIITDISVDKDNPDKVIVVRAGTGSNHVYYSSDATSTTPTWTAIDGNGSNGLPGVPVYGVEFIANASTNETVIVGTEFGAFVTDDISGSGTDWTPLNDQIGLVPVFDVRQQWRSRDQGVENPFAVYLGTHGRGLWKSDDVLSISEPIIEEDKKEIDNIVVYPNPLTNEGKLGFSVNENASVEITIYDLQGKVLQQLRRSNLSKGKHVIPFNTTNLPSGTYLISLKTDISSEITKFVKY